MRSLAVASFLLLTPQSPLLADEVADKIKDGVRLHDAQDYDGAMAIYRSILKDHPHHPSAVYELAYSMRAAGVDKSEVLAFLENETDSGTPQHFSIYILLGSAYDDAGELEKGERAFRRGLEVAQDSPDLHYNLAVNLSYQKRWPEAMTAYVSALSARPEHASSWFGLANACDESGRSPRAFVAYARAASMEPASARGRDGAARLWPLLFAYVEKEKDAKPGKPANVTISIPSSPETEQPQSKKKRKKKKDDASDPVAMEALGTSIVAANRWVEEWETKSDAAFFAHALDSVTAIASELEVKDDAFWAVVLPYFDDARAKNLLEPMAYVLRDAAGDADAKRWLEENRKRADSFEEWARSRKK
jgi:tetratricopeptide (TPR) repeat protein